MSIKSIIRSFFQGPQRVNFGTARRGEAMTKGRINAEHVNSAGAVLKAESSGNVLTMTAPVGWGIEIEIIRSLDSEIVRVWLVLKR